MTNGVTLWNSLSIVSFFLIGANFFWILCCHNIILEPNIVSIFVRCPRSCFIHHVWNNAKVPVAGKLHWNSCMLVRTGHKSMNVNHWDQFFLSWREILGKWSIWRKLSDRSVSYRALLTWSHSDQFITFYSFFNIFIRRNWNLFMSLINWIEN